MRAAFVKALLDVATADPRVWLVTGDLGYSVLEPFIERFGVRFLNAGVAEQNMMGVAAGLARAGKIVFVYSIANFPVMRCLEQVRNDVAYHALPVKIVAVGGGLVYGGHGYTHHATEDIGVMRLMPNMTVCAPADPVEAAWATRLLADLPGPGFLRLGRGGETALHKEDTAQWDLGRPIRVRSGAGPTLVATAGGVRVAVEAAGPLDAAVFSAPALVPLVTDEVFAAARTSGMLVSVEDHGRGGLGTILAERLAQRPEPFRFRSLCLSPEPVRVAGSEAYLRGAHGVTADAVMRLAREPAGCGK